MPESDQIKADTTRRRLRKAAGISRRVLVVVHIVRAPQNEVDLRQRLFVLFDGLGLADEVFDKIPSENKIKGSLSIPNFPST